MFRIFALDVSIAPHPEILCLCHYLTTAAVVEISILVACVYSFVYSVCNFVISRPITGKAENGCRYRHETFMKLSRNFQKGSTMDGTWIKPLNFEPNLTKKYYKDRTLCAEVS